MVLLDPRHVHYGLDWLDSVFQMTRSSLYIGFDLSKWLKFGSAFKVPLYEGSSSLLYFVRLDRFSQEKIYIFLKK